MTTVWALAARETVMAWRESLAAFGVDASSVRWVKLAVRHAEFAAGVGDLEAVEIWTRFAADMCGLIQASAKNGIPARQK